MTRPAKGPLQSVWHACAQRESFDVIGKVGFGADFKASVDINSRVNTFQLISDNLEEGIRRIFNPFRQYSLSKVHNSSIQEAKGSLALQGGISIIAAEQIKAKPFL